LEVDETWADLFLGEEDSTVTEAFYFLADLDEEAEEETEDLPEDLDEVEPVLSAPRFCLI
jgi:hypothetical protein